MSLKLLVPALALLVRLNFCFGKQYFLQVLFLLSLFFGLLLAHYFSNSYSGLFEFSPLFIPYLCVRVSLYGPVYPEPFQKPGLQLLFKRKSIVSLKDDYCFRFYFSTLGGRSKQILEFWTS